MLFQEFTHLYPLSKTLRFELKPIGKTLEHIHAKNFLGQDETLADMYQKVKAILDDYHRAFIADMMSEVQLTRLAEFYDVYLQFRKTPKDDALQKQLKALQMTLRKEIVKPIGKGGKCKDGYDRLFGAKLFRDGKELGDLAKFIIAQESESSLKLAQIAHFEKFSTYFTGFHDNRKNMYSDEEKHTAIAYRLIHENLPRFIDNLQILLNVKQRHSALYDKIENKLSVNGLDLSLASKLDGYHHLLTQEGITAYNALLGGISGEAGSHKIQGVNELINTHYNQHCQKSERIAKLRPLHKQILSDGMGVSFLPNKLMDDAELCQAVNEFYRHYADIFTQVQSVFAKFEDYRKDGIYVEHKNLTELSKRVFDDFGLLIRALDGYYVDVIYPKFNEKLAQAKTDSAKNKLLKGKEKFIKTTHSLAQLEQVIEHYTAKNDDVLVQSDKLVQYFKHGLAVADNPIQKMHNSHSTIKGFLECERPAGERSLTKAKANKSPEIRQLKELLDNALNVVHFAKLLTTKTTLDNQDSNFYGEFGALYDELVKIAMLYNRVRDYVSQKSFSTEKYKLNFGNPTLINGWDLNKEKDNFGVILQKEGCYYLALLDKDHKKVFDNAPNAGKKTYQKMVYKLLPGPNKMLPKVFFAKSNLDYYNPSAKLLEKYAQGTHKKGDNFNLKDCHALIDFFKASIDKHPEWQHFGFEFSPTSSYKDLSDFYREVEPQGYRVKFIDIDADYVDDLVEQGRLYLFQIYNKDFAPKAHGKPDLHTLYFKALFSDDNLANPIYKLNGEAEIFYRKASLKLSETTIHRAGEALDNKNPNNPKVRKFDYDIIKNKRYTQDKFMLHVPITMNFGVQDIGIKGFNQKVNVTLHDTQAVNVIGIDRGERHLLYLTVINHQGEILEQHSLNDITTVSADGVQMTTPYQKILDKREKERLAARVDWGEIETIKELKSGYLSYVVHQVSQLMLKYNAIVVLEDLNFGFKRGRFKVEKQVYQKFENALIKKLNHLVLKDKMGDDIGSVKNALQLTNNFSDLKSIGKQTGFLFYVPAWNTSKIDPVTGFVDLLKPSYENVAQSQAFFGKFDKICYNVDKGYFEFHVDYVNFTDKARNSRQKWVICSHGDKRYVYEKPINNKQGATVTINVNERLKKVFVRFGIDVKQPSLVEQICQNADKKLHQELIYLLRVLLAMRYSNTQSGEDFILSPVANQDGVFFNSADVPEDGTLPKDADANGAFHIALKGLWALQQIQNSDDLNKVNLAIDNQTWLNFVQNR